jgi:hypothetical protein
LLVGGVGGWVGGVNVERTAKVGAKVEPSQTLRIFFSFHFFFFCAVKTFFLEARSKCTERANLRIEDAKI